MMQSLALLLLLALVGVSDAFRAAPLALRRTLLQPSSSSSSPSSSTRRAAASIQQPFLLSDGGGLDADTLQALGEVTELNDALDGALTAANPAAGIVTNLVASPFFILIPIGAGLTVAFIVGFFIFSYGQGKE